MYVSYLQYAAKSRSPLRPNQQRLIRFMDRLIRTSNQKIFLILDNLKVLHGRKATAWLDRHQDKIELFFLPPYAPESNSR